MVRTFPHHFPDSCHPVYEACRGTDSLLGYYPSQDTRTSSDVLYRHPLHRNHTIYTLYNINIRYNSISGLYGYFKARLHNTLYCIRNTSALLKSSMETIIDMLGNPGPLYVAHKYNIHIPTTISEYIYNCPIAKYTQNR